MKYLVFTFLQESHKCFIRIDLFELISKVYSITFSWYVTNSILIYCLSFFYFLKFHLICWQNRVICPGISHRQGFDNFPSLVSFNTFLFPVFFYKLGVISKSLIIFGARLSLSLPGTQSQLSLSPAAHPVLT